MAKTKKEEVVEVTTKEVVEETTKQEQPKVDDKVEKLKVKPRMKKFEQNDDPIKVDLSKPVVEEKVEETKVETPVKEVKEDEVKETPPVEEITEEEQKEVEEVKEEVIRAVDEAEETGEPVPENIEKLMQFMDDTGGDLEDYVKLNRDTSKLDDQDVLYEYYKETKPHLNNEEINFLLNDQFEYDEEVDEEKDIKRKKLALKEQVASARVHLDGQKSKYYEEIKAGSKLTPDQQKAIDFFNRYNKESETVEKEAEQQKSNFLQKTNELFDNKFKGFEYNVGDKRFRLNVKDTSQIKETQSNINNFIKKFLDKKESMKDAKGYHKGLFTAMNPDAVAQHFYEQGKADAIKDTVAKDKNISINPRQAHGEVEAGGIKVRVLGEDSSDFKFKIKNKK